MYLDKENNAPEFIKFMTEQDAAAAPGAAAYKEDSYALLDFLLVCVAAWKGRLPEEYQWEWIFPLRAELHADRSYYFCGSLDTPIYEVGNPSWQVQQAIAASPEGRIWVDDAITPFQGLSGKQRCMTREYLDWLAKAMHIPRERFAPIDQHYS